MGSVQHDLGLILTRQTTPRETFDGPQEAIVAACDAGGLYVTIPDFSSAYRFGPAAYSRPVATVGYPPIGTRCLVTFVGTGVDRPWVTCFSAWPA